MRLETLTLSTHDLPRSRAFYTAKLGFRVVEERDGQSFIVDCGGIKLHVDKDVAKRPLSQAEPRLSFYTKELPQRCAELRDRGISVEGPRPHDAGLMAELTDPDGHPITLYERN